MKYSVLFVCTGNTCRSPMAEGLLKHFLPETLAEVVRVRSAGSMGDGYPATDFSVEVCREMNIDISAHKSTKIREELINEADLILTMTAGHREGILFIDPRAHIKTFQLAEFAGSGVQDIADPIGHGLSTYRHTRDELIGYIRQIIPKIENEVNQQIKSHNPPDSMPKS